MAQGDEARRRVAVQVSLPLIDALRGLEEDYFGLCVRSGDAVLRAMLEEDRTELCGPKWERGAPREVVRAGTTRSEVTLGGRRVAITRPRARTSEGTEVVLPTFAWAASRDPLDRATLGAVSAVVSTRGYAHTLDPLPAGVEDRATAKSSVSRRFVAMSAAKLSEWLNAPLADLELEAILIDGIHFAEHCVLIALGLTAQGQKKILGLHEGGTEKATVAARSAGRRTASRCAWSTPMGRPGMKARSCCAATPRRRCEIGARARARVEAQRLALPLALRVVALGGVAADLTCRGRAAPSHAPHRRRGRTPDARPSALRGVALRAIERLPHGGARWASRSL